MPRAIPSFDLVARALAALGHGRAAIELLELVVARGGEEALRAEPVLATLRSHPDVLLAAPGVRIDDDLLEAIASNGRLREALVVGRALDRGSTVLGLEILQALEVVLAPIAEGEPADMLACYRDGLGGSIVAAQRVALSPTVSKELRHRAQWLVQLLRGFRVTGGASAQSVPIAVDPAVASVVSEMLVRRDLVWGRQALEALVHLVGGAELLEAVTLLGSATESVAREDRSMNASTAPIEGDAVALLHVRMLNVEQAERSLRRLCVERPDDKLSPQLLDALLRLRAIQPRASHERPSEPPKAAPPDWLNKRARRASVEGWGAVVKRSTPVSYEDATTSVLRPDDEAELHLRAGRPDKAIELYERLAERYPDRPRFRQRADEIRAQSDARALMFADEMTVRQDVRKLAAERGDVEAAPAPASPAPASPAPPIEASRTSEAAEQSPAAAHAAEFEPMMPAATGPALAEPPVPSDEAILGVLESVRARPDVRTIEMTMHFAHEPTGDDDRTPVTAPQVEALLDAGVPAASSVAVRPIIGIG